MDPDLVAGFSQYVEDAAAALLSITDDESAAPRLPGKWSRKEIVGHLIDSAANNQGRFVRAQLQEDLTFAGYDQDAWVRVQRYGGRSWAELVEVWRSYNRQIAAIMRSASSAELSRPRQRHNLDQIAFQTLPDGAAATLGFLMSDYVVHLKHHVSQILEGSSASPPRSTDRPK
jgi:hypothetical protein